MAEFLHLLLLFTLFVLCLPLPYVLTAPSLYSSSYLIRQSHSYTCRFLFLVIVLLLSSPCSSSAPGSSICVPVSEAPSNRSTRCSHASFATLHWLIDAFYVLCGPPAFRFCYLILCLSLPVCLLTSSCVYLQ